MNFVVISQSNLQKALIIFLTLIVSFFLSEYGAYLGLQVMAPFAAILMFGWRYLSRGNISIKKWIILYSIIMMILALMNIQNGSKFNFVVFTPVISYFLLFSFKDHKIEKLENFSISLLYIFIIPAIILELIVKLRFLDVSIVNHFITQSGDARLDVLRIKSPFGSPLSLSSMCFAMIFYFSVFTCRKKEIVILFIILIMTGSRTSLIASIIFIMFLYSMYALSRGRKIIVNFRKIVWILPFIIIFLTGSIYYLDRIGMGDIVTRVLSLQSYDIGHDESFLGRSNTTVSTILTVFDDLPKSLFVGQDQNLISDSSVVTISAQSGLLTAIIFLLTFFMSVAKLNISMPYKIGFSVLFLLLLLMVGDAVVPLISFFYFLVFFVHSGKRGLSGVEESQNQIETRPAPYVPHLQV